MSRAENNNRMYRLFRALYACYCLTQAGRAYAAEEATTAINYESCNEMRPQQMLDVKFITGIWYVIEIIQHKIDERFYHGDKLVLDLCPYINLTYTNARTDTELKFSWEEEDGNIEYRFKINDKQSAGTWISSGAQNGTLVKRTYDQFAGSVTVWKAVNGHMVLMFCSPNTQLYSVVVARSKQLDPKDLKSIISLMNMQKLPITQRRLTCRSSSSTASAAVWLTVAAAAICLRLSDLSYKTN